MKNTAISTFQLFQMFPDKESARLYIEKRRWPKGPVCPFCKETERITVRKGEFYRCNACLEDFTVRTNTIFERSHIPLHKWLYAWVGEQRVYRLRRMLLIKIGNEASLHAYNSTRHKIQT